MSYLIHITALLVGLNRIYFSRQGLRGNYSTLDLCVMSVEKCSCCMVELIFYKMGPLILLAFTRNCLFCVVIRSYKWSLTGAWITYAMVIFMGLYVLFCCSHYLCITAFTVDDCYYYLFVQMVVVLLRLVVTLLIG